MYSICTDMCAYKLNDKKLLLIKVINELIKQCEKHSITFYFILFFSFFK